MEKVTLLIFVLFFIGCSPDQFETPLEKNEYKSLTTYDELTQYVNLIAQESPYVTLKIMTVTSTGKSIPYILISDDQFGADTSKMKMMIFAQQHGNEQSGKEGALLLLKEIAAGSFYRELNEIDLILVPQVNPDGSDENMRRNAEDIDLNRDHLLLSTNEAKGLHRIFNRFKPHATLDVHEYYPYSNSWEEFGFIKYFDEQFGTVTNINIDSSIQRVQKEKLLPYVKEYLSEKDFTMNEYVLGGPPNEKRMRFSTVDINDGRQSMGIQNTFSMILEGKRGRDSLDNIKRRAEGQFYSMRGFMKFAAENKFAIKQIVKYTRKNLLSYNANDSAAIRMEHIDVKGAYPLKLRKVGAEKDTVIQVDNFHEIVKPLLKVQKPFGYLIPKEDQKLFSLMELHGVELREEIPSSVSFQKYFVEKINLSVDEELENKYPEVKVEKLSSLNSADYYFVPTTQLKSNMLVLALEPQSILGLVQYDEFNYLLEEQSYYPILRVIK